MSTLLAPAPADVVYVEVDPYVPCPVCDGHGEIVAAGDPRGPHFLTATCTECDGDGWVPLPPQGAEDARRPSPEPF